MTGPAEFHEPGEHLGHTLGLYVLGGLPPDAIARVDTHLDGCATCRDEVAELFEATIALSLISEEEARAALGRPPAPPPRRAVRSKHRPGPVLAYLRLAAVAAALALIAGFVVGLGLRLNAPAAPVAVAAAHADDTLTGVSLTVSVSGRDSRLTLSATIEGLRPGAHYTAYVVTKDGEAHAVHEWSSADGSLMLTREVDLPIETLTSFTIVSDDGSTVMLAWFQS